jgi:type II secretory pathway component PulF
LPLFRLEAKTQQGQLERHDLVAQTAQIAVRRLKARGLYVTQVRRLPRRRVRGPGAGWAAGLRPLAPREKALLCLQLHELLSAGIGIAEALHDVAPRVASLRLRQFLTEAAEAARQGVPLSQAMSERADLFEGHVAGAVAAAEEAGTLDGVFATLEQDYRALERDRRRLTFPLTYLKAVAGLSVVAMTIPVAITHGLLFWLTNTLVNGGPLLLAAVAAWHGARLVGRLGPVSALAERVRAHLPVTGPGRRVTYALRLLRAFREMTRAGALPQEALEVAAAAVGPSALEERARRGADHLRRGGSLAEALRYTGLLDRRIAGLLETAEETGELDATLTECLRMLEDDDQRESLRRTVWSWALILLLTALVVLAATVIGWRALYDQVLGFYDRFLAEE